MGAGTDPRMREALRLARAGENEQARHLIIEILQANRDDFDAWAVMAQVVDDPQEAINSIKQALRVRPHDERAQRYLDYLVGNQGSEVPVKVLRKSQGLLAGLAVTLIVGLVLASIFVLPKLTQAGQVGDDQTETIDCAALIKKALEVSDRGCYQVGRNQVCYGHNTLYAQLAPGSDLRFEKPGSIIPISMLKSVNASPLDLEKGDWGVGVFKLEANLPGTLPGQLVTLLVLGNTSITNITGDMQTFYFMSSLGGIRCDTVPFDGILVRIAQGAGFTFRANGVDITLQGDSILRATANQQLTVTALEGTSTVGVAGQEQSMNAGQEVKVPLGGSSGLEPQGPPSLPEDAGDAILNTGCALTGTGCPPTISPSEITATPGASPETNETVEPTGQPSRTVQAPVTLTQPPAFTQTPKPSKTPRPTLTPRPTVTLRPSPAPRPTRAPHPTRVPNPTNAPAPTETPDPIGTPLPTEDPRPTKEPKPTKD